MATITQEQLNTIINGKPTGVATSDILASLKKRGYQIEGLDIPVAQNDQQTSVPFLSGVADFFGAEKFARGVGRAAFNLFPSDARTKLREAEESFNQPLTEGQKNILREGGEGAERLRSILGRSNAITQGIEETRTGNLSNKEILGSAALLGLSAAAPGLTKGATTARTAGRLAGVGAAGGALGAAEDDGTVQDAINMAIIGGALGGIAPFAGKGVRKGIEKGLVKPAKEIVKRTVSVLSGKPVDVIETAFDRPGAARAGMKMGETALEDIAQSSQKRISELSRNLSKTYKETADDIFASVKEDLASIKEPLIGNARSIVEDFGVVADDAGELSFATSAIVDTAETSRVQRAFNLLQSWDDYSLKGLNTLRQRVGELRRFDSASGTRSSAIVGRMYNAINSALREYADNPNTPDDASLAIRRLTDLNKQFGSQRDFLDALELVFKDAKGGRKETIQVANKLATLFNANKDATRRLIEDLEEQTGEDILGTLAGVQLQGDATRFQLGAGNPILNLVQATGIPQMLARQSGNTGSLDNFIRENIINRLDEFSRLSEPAKINAIRSIAEEINRQNQNE